MIRCAPQKVVIPTAPSGVERNAAAFCALGDEGSVFGSVRLGHPQAAERPSPNLPFDFAERPAECIA
jgi:hypothetical protein